MRRDKKLHLSIPHEIRFWKIEEAVGGGNYIVLPLINMTEKSAIKAFPAGTKNCRAVEYEQSHTTAGPKRVT